MSAAAVAAIRAYIAANWTHCAIAEPNGSANQPADLTPFLTVRFPMAKETQMSTGDAGNNVFLLEGGFVVTLSIPLGTPLDDAAAPWRTRLDTLRGLLRLRTDISGVITYETDGVLEDEGEEGGAYYEMSFAVEYSSEIHG